MEQHFYVSATCSNGIGKEVFQKCWKAEYPLVKQIAPAFNTGSAKNLNSILIEDRPKAELHAELLKVDDVQNFF